MTNYGAASDLDRTTRPGKWQKRGVQPPVDPVPKTNRERLVELLEAIRFAKDPAEKERLERAYTAECEAFDGIIDDPTVSTMPSICTEMAESFSSSSLAKVEFQIPPFVEKDQWEGIHRAILACRNSAARWLSKSRRFATERWGADYVARAESQLELDLGIEAKPDALPMRTVSPAARIAAFARSWEKAAKEMGSIEKWDESALTESLQALEQLAEAIDKMRQALAAGGPTTR